MSDDLISRNEAIQEIEQYIGLNKCSEDTRHQIVSILLRIPSADPEPQWIPFEMREMTAEEKEEYPDWDYIVDCPLPDDGEEILVSDGKYVWLDTYCCDDGCYLDGGTELEGLAWMKLPTAWKKEKK
ncbi:MAG: hypothetical protein IJI57_04705 [Flexilinea sp.]|nr:hypothetical protein [Flexilinea sp.]